MQGMQSVEVAEKTISLRVSPEIANPQFRLIGPVGEAIQTLALEPDMLQAFAGALEKGVEEPQAFIHAPNESVDPNEIANLALAEALFLQGYAKAR